MDTSVFGGVFDSEFTNASIEFFKEIRDGQFLLVTSAIVNEEINYALRKVQDFFTEQLAMAEIIEVNTEAVNLREAYLNAGILSKKYSNDALHVALASVTKCKIIVNWNFKHIVHFNKIPLYNAVNMLNSYNQIAIHSPLEVINYGE